MLIVDHQQHGGKNPDSAMPHCGMEAQLCAIWFEAVIWFA